MVLYFDRNLETLKTILSCAEKAAKIRKTEAVSYTHLNTVTVIYTKCKNATGYEILLGNKYKTSAGEKYPVKKHLKRTEGKNTVTVTLSLIHI